MTNKWTNHLRSARTIWILISFVLLAGACSSGSSGAGLDTVQPAAMEPGTLTTAPLRNTVKVVLRAPIGEVWAVVSDHSQLASYSAGVKAVAVDKQCSGPGGGVGCARTCSFHQGPSLVEKVVYVQPPRSLATSAVEPNAYQLTNDLTLVTLRRVADNRTEFMWRQYYDHPSVDTMVPVFKQALQDLGKRLAKRFGGHIVR